MTNIQQDLSILPNELNSQEHNLYDLLNTLVDTERSISNLLFSEGNKIDYAIKVGASTKQLNTLNKNTLKILSKVTHLENVLCYKLQLLLDLLETQN